MARVPAARRRGARLTADGSSGGGWVFWIDRGGTFTDVVGRDPSGALHVEKLLSHARAYTDAAVEGVARLLTAHAGPSEDWRVDEVRMGTTVATNALLERSGEPTLLATTRGHADALSIGRQDRPRLFDLNIRKAAPLYARVIEIDERITAEGAVLRALDEGQARQGLGEAYAAGLRAVAIVLMHGHRHTTHEARVAELAREIGFTQVSVSFETSALVKLVPRGETTVADAYLSPGLARYVAQASSELRRLPGAASARLLFMQSNGGLAEAQAFKGRDAVLSGPAGGVVGLAAVAVDAGLSRVIGFDMGGTSTDVSRYAGVFERSYETEVAGVRLRAPMMSLETVAAGGGSVCRFENGRLRVGPQSAGADPGPAAYGRGGPLTVTDCNFMLGKLQPTSFPAVFGTGGRELPNLDAVRQRFDEACDLIGGAGSPRPTPQALAEGFVTVAVENMARAIRRISIERGYDPKTYALVSFGGAGGQHACLLAEALGVESIVLHPLAGVLSAYGVGRAELTQLRAVTVESLLLPENDATLARLARDLSTEATDVLVGQGGDARAAVCAETVFVKYAGTDTALPVPLQRAAAVRADFERAHRARFGFVTPRRALMVETLTVEARIPAAVSAEAPSPEGVGPGSPALACVAVRMAGRLYDTPVHARDGLCPGVRLEGPRLIQEATGAVVVEPGWSVRVDTRRNLVLEREPVRQDRLDVSGPPTSVPLDLELFASRFMAVAEGMGEALRQTALSVNIKERLDFSCAVFDGDGALVANAPHIPVHLGSMGDCVRTVVVARRADGRGLVRGDVYASNDPYAGGTHLPDITVVAPVFAEAEAAEPFAFVAARGHHADIGGLTPGSMPPDSRTIADEGVRIHGLLLVDGAAEGGARFCENEARACLGRGPHPARDPDTNIADLKAQVAACARGARELDALVSTFGRDRVEAYMGFVQDNAEAAVRATIRGLEGGRFVYGADAGHVVAVEVRVDRSTASATVDFTGTSAQLETNFNAPAAITRAAVMYVFRTLVQSDIPLNDGCLRPIEIVIPEGCMLSPRFPAAVVAGNVETSQVVVDALYGALGIVAASQGTMNNLTFGDATRQYYETICGGAGAGPDFDGADAVQTHMTNSRLTDPEILETRFPVLVDGFAIRRGSGGAGAHKGGDGVVRRLVFREPMTVSILADRRRVPPFGLKGGAPGAVGSASVERADGGVETLGSTGRRDLFAGDAIVIETPGGGGFG